jgi:hypothetical protein
VTREAKQQLKHACSVVVAMHARSLAGPIFAMPVEPASMSAGIIDGGIIIGGVIVGVEGFAAPIPPPVEPPPGAIEPGDVPSVPPGVVEPGPVLTELPGLTAVPGLLEPPSVPLPGDGFVVFEFVPGVLPGRVVGDCVKPPRLPGAPVPLLSSSARGGALHPWT